MQYVENIVDWINEDWETIEDTLLSEEVPLISDEEKKISLGRLRKLVQKIDFNCAGYAQCQRVCECRDAEALCLLLAGGLGLWEEDVVDRSVVIWEDFEKAKSFLIQRIAVSKEWDATLTEIKSNNDTRNTRFETKKHNDVFLIYQQVFPDNKVTETLLDNLELLIEKAYCSKRLTSILPLYIYQMLTRHSSRLHKNIDLRINVESLWNPIQYLINKDNGKNYKTNTRYLLLFQRLCDAFEKEANIEICQYGFFKLTNLTEFFWSEYPNDTSVHLPVLLEDWIHSFAFSCFPHGYNDAVVFRESGLTVEQLMQFETSAVYERSLKEVSTYMNAHAFELFTKFNAANDEEVKRMCSEILATLPIRLQPKCINEIELFLVSINCGLLELTDHFANEMLIKTAKELTRE